MGPRVKWRFYAILLYIHTYVCTQISFTLQWLHLTVSFMNFATTRCQFFFNKFVIFAIKAFTLVYLRCSWKPYSPQLAVICCKQNGCSVVIVFFNPFLPRLLTICMGWSDLERYFEFQIDKWCRSSYKVML